MSAYLGADILRAAPDQYRSSVEYGDNMIAQQMKDIAQVMCADVGTRVFYTQHGSYDTHSGELLNHATLWGRTLQRRRRTSSPTWKSMDLKTTLWVMVFSEFGRRIGRQRLRNRPRIGWRRIRNGFKRQGAASTASTRH